MHAVQANGFDAGSDWIERSPRVVRTLLIARLFRNDGHEHLCRIRNISDTGMMIETPAPLAPEDLIAVELRGGKLAGTVIWAEEGRAGIQFPAPIDMAQVLGEARMAAVRTDRPRSPRFRVEAPARISSYGRMIDVTVEDVSQSGARLRLPRPPRPESEVILSIPGLPSRRCTTRWTGEDSAGFVFHDIIPYHDLATWLVAGGRRT